jgi:hypothetical protein
MITGTIEWPGHALTRPVVFLDIEPGPGVVPYLGLGFLGDPVTGQFTMSYDLDIPITACVVAWDDLNQNDLLEMGGVRQQYYRYIYRAVGCRQRSDSSPKPDSYREPIEIVTVE